MGSFRSGSFFLLLTLVLGSCGAEPGGCQASSWLSPSERLLGNPAPNFVLSRLDGEKVELARTVKEKPILLVFWATWCPACVEEIPTLNEWHKKFPDLQILGVNVQESAERVRAFAKKRRMEYPILLDSRAEVAHDYGLVGIPASVLVAKGGRVIYYGFALPRNLDQLIRS